MSELDHIPRLFISYSSKDKDIVKVIHQEIEDAGLDVWRDQTRLETDWSREIAYALAESDILCLIWSEQSADSKWVEHEWLTARALEKRIIPLLLPDAPKLPEPLDNAQSIKVDVNEPINACQELIKRVDKSNDYTEPYDYHGLPENSYIPFTPNPQFTGRHTDLLELYLKMIGDLNNIGINQVGTVGMGGIGKTQLAVEFAYRYSFAFNNVFWIQAAEPGDWLTQFVELARDRLELPISDPEKPLSDKRYIFALQKYCKENPQTLIVMDNVVEPDKLNNDTYLFGITPLTLGCNILFTTRKHFRLLGVTSQSVDILSKEAAYHLLTNEREPESNDEKIAALGICNAIGYLPLAIALASGYLNKYEDVTFTDYRDELFNNKLGAIDIGEVTQEELSTRHVAAVSLTLDKDWEKLTDKNARQLFLLAGQFGEAEIIIKARLGLLAGIESGKSKLHRPLDRAFNLLHDLSLVERLEDNTKAIRLHPLIRDFAYWLIPDYERPAYKATSAKKLKDAYFHFTRLKIELEQRNVQALINDFQNAIDWWDDDKKELEELSLLQDTLRLSTNQITRDKEQLAPHLIGRLLEIEKVGIKKLVMQAKNNIHTPCLLPLTNSLITPGGSLIWVLEGHSNTVKAVAITPDGKKAISASYDYTLKVWDLSSGSELHSLIGHNDWVTAVAITPDGKRAISASNDNSLKIWDLSSGSELHNFKGHSCMVHAIGITPDGNRAISANNDKTLKVWDLSSGSELHSLEGHSMCVRALAITPDGNRVVSASCDHTLKVWDLSSGNELHCFEGHSGFVNAVAITPDGKKAISASYDYTLKVWDLSSGSELHSLEGHSESVNTVVITPDGNRAVSASDEGILKVWDLSSGSELHNFKGHSWRVNAVAITPEGDRVVSASTDGTLKIWDLSSSSKLHKFKGYSLRVDAVVIAPDGNRAVSVSKDNTLKVWDLSSGSELYSYGGHSEWLTAKAITPDGKTAVSDSWDDTFKVWDLSTGSELNSLAGINSIMVAAVAITPDGNRVVSATNDNTLKVWDLQLGSELHSHGGHSERLTAVAITPDGNRAVSASMDHTLKVWDLSSGSELHSLEGHSCSVKAVAITPDGKRAVSASDDRTLKVWDLSSGSELHSIEGHSWIVEAVAITPDGKTAVSASADNTLKAYDLETGIEITQFIGESTMQCCDVSPDGKTIVAGEQGGSVHILSLVGMD